jgi:hypothetical protein
MSKPAQNLPYFFKSRRFKQAATIFRVIAFEKQIDPNGSIKFLSSHLMDGRAAMWVRLDLPGATFRPFQPGPLNTR